MKEHPQPRPTVLDSGALRTFLTVVQAGGIGAAAKALNRSPSAVSMQIKKLEGQLGTALFERSARRLVLTISGEKFSSYARRLVCLSNEAVAALTEPHLRSRVRVGVPGEINERILPAIVRQLAFAHPGIMIDVTAAPNPNLVRLFEARELELMLTFCDERFCSPGDTIGTERLVWAGARDGRAYQHTPLPIAIPDDKSSCYSTVLTDLRQQKRQFRIAYANASTCVRQAAVMADLAVSPIFYSCLTEGLVELGADDGFEMLPDFETRLLRSDDAGEAAVIVSNALREFYSEFVPAVSEQRTGELA